MISHFSVWNFSHLNPAKNLKPSPNCLPDSSFSESKEIELVKNSACKSVTMWKSLKRYTASLMRIELTICSTKKLLSFLFNSPKSIITTLICAVLLAGASLAPTVSNLYRPKIFDGFYQNSVNVLLMFCFDQTKGINFLVLVWNECSNISTLCLVCSTLQTVSGQIIHYLEKTDYQQIRTTVFLKKILLLYFMCCGKS
jgi:hypothetical protein